MYDTLKLKPTPKTHGTTNTHKHNNHKNKNKNPQKIQKNTRIYDSGYKIIFL